MSNVSLNEPLDDLELSWLEDVLDKYGNDDSILDVSALDGFLTAVVSGPELLQPDVWMPEIWAGESPAWASDEELQRFTMLVLRHMNVIVEFLTEAPEEFEAMFQERDHDGEELLIAESWCSGYLRGVELGQWPELPPGLQPHIMAIALHGSEDMMETLDGLTLDQHQAAVADVEPAVRAIHEYFFDRRPMVPADRGIVH